MAPNKNDELTVLGDGAITIIDGAAISLTIMPSAQTDESSSLFDIKLHAREAADTIFELRAESAFTEKDAKSRGKTQAADDEEKQVQKP